MGEGVLAFLKNVAAFFNTHDRQSHVMKGGLGNQHSHSVLRGGGPGGGLLTSDLTEFLFWSFRQIVGPTGWEAELEEQPPTRREPDASAQQQPDQQGEVSAELSRNCGISERHCPLSSLVTDLEGMAKNWTPAC